MISYRNLSPFDFDQVTTVINDWWGGRDMAHLLPKLFFVHFNDTSFIAEENGRIAAFLIGFLSQANPDEAYIHFVGVHPDYRKTGMGKELYERFFDEMKVRERYVVRSITSPKNEESILFHQRLGFEIADGDEEINGIPVNKNYGGPGIDRVLFLKRLPHGKEIW